MEKSDGAGAGASSGGGKRAAPMQCTLKFLAPEVMAAAVIGKGGAVIAAMRTSCSAKIVLTEHSEVYPQTDCRVLTAQANSEEALNEVSKQIVAKIGELVNTTASDAVGTEGELKIRMLVPRAAVGGVIGKGGASIKHIRETSGAKISITEPAGSGPGAEQLVAVAGSAEAVEFVLEQVNQQIQMLNGEAWFSTWASTPGVVKAGQGGGYTAGLPGSSAGAMPPMMPGLRSAAAGGQSYHGVDIMMHVANHLPPYVMEDSRGFALSCVIPNRLVGGLIGRGGSGTKEVQALTGTKIGIREIEGDKENRSLNIAGPIANTCAAYMLMMKRYLDAEAQSLGGNPPGR